MLQIGYTPHSREVEDENLGLPGIVSVGDFTEFSRGGLVYMGRIIITTCMARILGACMKRIIITHHSV